ncbi:hypothetical protein WDW86_09905 [Bdellovibrionota bacterium FG-2]
MVVKTLEEKVLNQLRKPGPKKKRVTFFISEDAKAALAKWCTDKKVKESPALEEMIRAVIPMRYFSGGK